MSNKYVGLGFTLTMNSTLVAGIRNISHGEASGNAVDVTCMDDYSSTDRYMRKAGGLVDPGTLNLDLAYDPVDGSHASLMAALNGGSTHAFIITFPTTTISQTFTGIVNGVGQEIPFGELVTCAVRIDKSGAPGFQSST